MSALNLRHIKQYRDLAWLLMKHGMHQSGLEKLKDAQDAAGAQRLASDLEKLGPTYVKLGQLLSSRTDMLPEDYIASLARLQDDVEPFAFEQVEHIVTSELGVRLSKAF